MNKKTIYSIGAAAVIIGLGILLFGGNPKPSPLTPGPANGPTIISAIMSRSIDTKGNATGAATTFNTKTDKIVYAVLTLKNVTKDTKLSYVRYLNGTYIDSKVALAGKDGITNFYFAFEKGIGDYPKGAYSLNLYVNGRKSQSVSYTFK